MLQKELPGDEAVLPDLNHVAVVDGVTQLGQRHVQLVHSGKKKLIKKNNKNKKKTD
jgi:hypothetical protein